MEKPSGGGFGHLAIPISAQKDNKTASSNNTSPISEIELQIWYHFSCSYPSKSIPSPTNHSL